jgi:hypothetical protein
MLSVTVHKAALEKSVSNCMSDFTNNAATQSRYSIPLPDPSRQYPSTSVVRTQPLWLVVTTVLLDIDQRLPSSFDLTHLYDLYRLYMLARRLVAILYDTISDISSSKCQAAYHREGNPSCQPDPCNLCQ